MKISVIGAGNMASAFVKQLHGAGHQVNIASRDVAKANALAAQYTGVVSVPMHDIAKEADAIVLATGYGDAAAALTSANIQAGQIVIDITNPLTADFMGLTVGHSTSAAEEISKAVPQAHVVKAFNTLFAAVLSEGADFGNAQKVTVFVASDNAASKEAVQSLATSMGFVTIDAGVLKNARYLEPLAGLNIYLGYGAGFGTSVAPTWIRKV